MSRASLVRGVRIFFIFLSKHTIEAEPFGPPPGCICMKLPLKEFVDVVHGLGDQKKEMRVSDGRDPARIEVSAKVALHVLKDHTVASTLNVLTSDISLSGMSVFQSVAMPVGTQVIIALPCKEKLLSVHALVVRSTGLAEGVYAAALEFTRLVEPDPQPAPAKST